MKHWKTILALSLMILSQRSLASEAVNQIDAETKTSLENHRGEKRMGAYLSVLGDPHPTLVGANLAYNLLPFLRASLGFGKVSVSTMTVNNDGFASEEKSMMTIGTAAKFMMPGWNLTPSATLGYSHISMSEGMKLDDYKSSNVYLGVGGDWQAESGFNLGAGLNVSVNSAAPTAPYLNVGMFF